MSAQELGLDAAFPPSPALWCADMASAGASVGFVYVHGDFLNYTPAHVTLARAKGLTVAPIVVPGNNPPSFATIWSALLNYGFASGPVFVDLEMFSLPPDGWVKGLHAFLFPLGYWIVNYGTTSTLGHYSPEDGDWVANWIRTGTLNPVPALPDNELAWQFVDDVRINGNTYDATVIHPDAFSAALFNPIPAPPQILDRRQEAMKYITVMVGTDDQQHVFWVDPKGAVRHKYWTHETNGWADDSPGISGMDAYAPLDVAIDNGALHFFVAAPDGSVRHGYQSLGSPNWTLETL